MDRSVPRGSVVVGVDGSEPSAAALDWAVRYAAGERRGVTVVHACGYPAVTDEFEDVVASERGLRSVGQAIVREAVYDVRLADDSVGVESIVTMGGPADVLVQASEAASVVVTGARGRGAVASALLGSVSAAVMRGAQCPVVVVRSFAERAGKPVVVGVDGSPASAAAVEFAFRRAAVDGVSLTLLHATWDLRTQASSMVETRTYGGKIDLSEEEERLVSETVAGLCERYPDVTVTEVYRRGEPTKQLVEASRDASLVVVGSRGRGLLTSTLLGSVSRGVVEQAGCPVAVVRPVAVAAG